MGAESFFRLETSDGISLEAGLRLPEGAGSGVVVCHPNPRGGGSMDNPFIETLVETLSEAGVATLRFQFRRPGEFDERRLDAQAAVAHLRGAMGPEASIYVSGWSYGADMAIATAARDPEIKGVVVVSAPLFPELEVDREILSGGRVLLIVPEHDHYAPPAVARERMPRATIEILPGADHFLSGMDKEAAEAVLRFVRETAASS